METTAGGIARTSKMHQTVTWTLIGLMLVLRIGILGIGEIVSNSAWLDPVFQVGTYFLTALFLWWEIKNLKQFHVDTLALLIILVFKPVQTLILLLGFKFDSMAFPHLPALLIWAIALGLGIACWLRRKELPRFEWKSLGFFAVGTVAGLLLGILLAVPMSFTAGIEPLTPSQFWTLVRQQGLTMFIYQIGYAGVTEEPLFRGFLWGALKKSGWRDVWIWLFQAGLFMLAHMYYFGRLPISMFVIVPVGSLALGLIVWKTRSISSSLPLHGAANAFGIMWAELVKYLMR